VNRLEILIRQMEAALEDWKLLRRAEESARRQQQGGSINIAVTSPAHSAEI
jgi:hypothetical protein